MNFQRWWVIQLHWVINIKYSKCFPNFWKESITDFRKNIGGTRHNSHADSGLAPPGSGQKPNYLIHLNKTLLVKIWGQTTTFNNVCLFFPVKIK